MRFGTESELRGAYHFIANAFRGLPPWANLFYAKKEFEQKGQKSEDTSLFKTLLPLVA